MALVEHTLFGVQDKVAIAIERLKSFEPPEGYYLAFSGGKDSITIKALADAAGVEYDAHYNVTGIDPPELVRFIRDYYPDVEWHHPRKTIFAMMLEDKLFPPRRLQRWCCELLKEQGGAGRLVVTGIRWAESSRRRNRKMVEHCLRGANRKFLHPIIDWKEKDVWEFIRARELPYCSLYDEGWKRIGCLMCPLATAKNRKRDAERYPRYARLWIRALQRLIDRRRERGNPLANWETGEQFFKWWIDEKPAAKDEDLPLFA